MRGAWFEWARSPVTWPCLLLPLWIYQVEALSTQHGKGHSRQLKQKIRAAFGQITAQRRQKTLLAYRERLEKVIENDGGHAELHGVIELTEICRNKILSMCLCCVNI